MSCCLYSVEEFFKITSINSDYADYDFFVPKNLILPSSSSSVLQLVDSEVVMLSAHWEKKKTSLIELQEQLQQLPGLIADLESMTTNLSKFYVDICTFLLGMKIIWAGFCIISELLKLYSRLTGFWKVVSSS